MLNAEIWQIFQDILIRSGLLLQGIDEQGLFNMELMNALRLGTNANIHTDHEAPGNSVQWCQHSGNNGEQYGFNMQAVVEDAVELI